MKRSLSWLMSGTEEDETFTSWICCGTCPQALSPQAHRAALLTQLSTLSTLVSMPADMTTGASSQAPGLQVLAQPPAKCVISDRSLIH